jgi:PAS domain-containing protein
MRADMQAWLCQQIVDHAQDAVVFADGDGVMCLWNAGAEVIFGYPAKAVVGHSIDLIIPCRLRARHWAGYGRLMATGVTGVRPGGTHCTGTAQRRHAPVLGILRRPSAKRCWRPARCGPIIRDVTARLRIQ